MPQLVSNIVGPALKQGLCGSLVHLSSRGVSLEAKVCPGSGGSDCLRLGGAEQVAFFHVTGGRRLVPKAPFLPTEHEEELMTGLPPCLPTKAPYVKAVEGLSALTRASQGVKPPRALWFQQDSLH